MLRMLEYSNHTYIFCALFKLLKKCKDREELPKLPGLIIKCILKMSRIMEKLIPRMDLAKFFVAIHEYLCIIDHDNRSKNDDLGIRLVKTIVKELVKMEKDDIWKSYKSIEDHPQPDDHIKRWIQILLNGLPVSQP